MEDGPGLTLGDIAIEGGSRGSAVHRQLEQRTVGHHGLPGAHARRPAFVRGLAGARLHQSPLRTQERQRPRPGFAVIQWHREIAAGDPGHPETGVEQLVPGLCLEHAELKHLDEVDRAQSKVHQQSRVLLAAVEVRVADRGAELTAAAEQDQGKGVGFGEFA